jgi:hypothetical protein
MMWHPLASLCSLKLKTWTGKRSGDEETIQQDATKQMLRRASGMTEQSNNCSCAEEACFAGDSTSHPCKYNNLLSQIQSHTF